jgi:hypothetical protein
MMTFLVPCLLANMFQRASQILLRTIVTPRQRDERLLPLTSYVLSLIPALPDLMLILE